MRFKIETHKVLTTVLGLYKDLHSPEEVEDSTREAEPAAASSKESNGVEGTASVAEESENNDIVIPSKAKCSVTNCKRKGPTSCANKMCFYCCFEQTNTNGLECRVHLGQARKREEENKLIEQSFMSVKSKEKRLYHFKETRITGTGQTVVIWCVYDFFSNHKWNKDVFELEERRHRQSRSLKRRLTNTAEKEFSPSSPGGSDEKRQKLRNAGAVLKTPEERDIKVTRHRTNAAKRYQEVLSAWTQRHALHNNPNSIFN